MRKSNFTLVLLFLSFMAFAQREPNKEILVFFKKDVKREVRLVNSKAVTSARVENEKLKAALSRLGIEEAALEIAMPRFKQADTLKVLSDGTKITQMDMTKLFRITVPEGKSREALLKQLQALPEILYAEPNGTVSHLATPSDTRFNNQWALNNTLNPGQTFMQRLRGIYLPGILTI